MFLMAPFSIWSPVAWRWKNSWGKYLEQWTWAPPRFPLTQPASENECKSLLGSTESVNSGRTRGGNSPGGWGGGEGWRLQDTGVSQPDVAYDKLMFSFIRNSKTVFQSAFPPKMNENSCCFTSWPTVDIVRCLDFSHSNRCVVVTFFFSFSF